MSDFCRSVEDNRVWDSGRVVLGSDGGGQLPGLWVEVQADVGTGPDPVVAGQDVVGSEGRDAEAGEAGQLGARIIKINGWGAREKSSLLGI